MPDGQLVSCFTPDELLPAVPRYVPPVALILQGLDATELDFAQPRVNVSAPFLRFLIGEMARSLPFDPNFYAAAYPDVEAARLAGDVESLEDHFVEQGYFERRQPCDLPFDAHYYATRYQDIAAVYTPSEAERLHSHFSNHGWQEGRAAVSWQRADADRWVAAARETGAAGGQ